jgi:hypothetical protein
LDNSEHTAADNSDGIAVDKVELVADNIDCEHIDNIDNL